MVVYATEYLHKQGTDPIEVVVFDKKSIESSDDNEEYVYRLRLRPFSVGTQPDGGTYVNDGSKYGAVKYNHKLTKEDIDNFSLMPITESQDLMGKVFEKPFLKGKITYKVESVDADGNVSYEYEYKGNVKHETADYIHFMEKLGDKAVDITNRDKSSEREGSGIEKQVSKDVNINHSEAQKAATETVMNALKKAGIPVKMVSAEEAANMMGEEGVELMGSRVDNRRKKIAEELADVEMTDEQKAIVDAFTGVAKNRAEVIITDKDGNEHVLVLVQGNEKKAGVKHSLFKHFGTKEDYYAPNEILLIPEIISHGAKEINGKRNVYTIKKDGVAYKLVTEGEEGKENFINFYTDKKNGTNASVQSPEGNTELTAQANKSSNSSAKVKENSESPKESEKISDSKGVVYGWTDGETIYLNEETINPDSPIHEYTHLWAKALQKRDPKTWNEIKGMLKETPVWDQVLNDKDYSDIHGDEDAVAREVLSRISGKKNAAKLEAEAQKRIDEANGVFEKAEAVTMRERIKDAVKKFWQWISEKLFGRKFKSVDDVTDRVLKDLLKGVKPESEKGKKEFMFIGKKGASNVDKMNEATGMLDGLKTAREMEKASKDAKAIKMATGWEKGKDGKWKYEMMDFVYKPMGDARKDILLEKQEWYKEFESLLDRSIMGETLNKEEQKRFEELTDKATEIQNQYDNTEKIYLDDYIDDKELFAAYPELRKTRIYFVDDMKAEYAGKVNEDGDIIINTARSVDDHSALAHEVQHVIQEIEGFAQGGNPTSSNRVMKEISTAIDALSDAAWGTIERYVKDGYVTKEQQTALEGIAKKYGFASVEKMMDGVEPYSFYQSLGGEVESRNVERRLDMSAEERRRTLAEETEDVAREDQIVLHDVFNAYSRDEISALDKEYMEAVKNKDEAKMRELVDKARKLKGYTEGEEYQGTTDQFGSAPSANGFYDTKEERLEAWRNDEFEDTQTFGDMADGIEINSNADYITGAQNPSRLDAARKEVVSVLKPLLKRMKDGDRDVKVRMYRAIPADVKDSKLRRGDWCTPSKLYSQEHGEHKFGEGKYRIVEEDVSPEEMWWDGNDIAEWGFDNEKDYAYRNTKNNRKSNDLITYDKDGNVIPLSERFDLNKSDENYSIESKGEGKTIEKVNDEFNKKLDTLTEENADSKIFSLGNPSDILLAAGVSDKEMKLYGNKILKKMKKHGFSLSELKNLPQAVANPIAVFDNLGREGNRSILTELKTEQGNFLATVDLGKNVDVDFNIISSVFGKNGESVLDWINKGFATYINKEKALAFLFHQSAPIAATAANEELSSVAKIINEFKNPNNIADNSSSKGDNVRFRDGDENKKSLVGIHNISEDKLRKAIKMGGLANPSTAVIDIDKQKFDGYGEISLVMPSSLVDKNSGKNAGTWTGDAWTPTYPQIHKSMESEGFKKVNDRISKVVSDKEMSDDMRAKFNGHIKAGNEAEMQYMFLLEKGMDLPVVTKHEEIIDIKYDDILKILGVEDEKTPLSELYKIYTALPENKRAEINRWNYAGGMKSKMDKVIKVGGTNTPLGKFWDPQRVATERIFSSFMTDVRDNGKTNGETDVYATNDAARVYVNEHKLDREYNKWLEELSEYGDVKEEILLGFDKEGNRKYVPHTLKNVSKYMAKEGEQNSYGATNFSATRSYTYDRLGTLEEIRQNKDRLTSEDINETVDKYAELYTNIVSTLSSMNEVSSNPFLNMDRASESMQEAFKANDPLFTLRRKGYKIPKGSELSRQIEDFINDVKALPSKYFETKFERPVMLNEFASAVVPDNVSEDIVKALERAGLKVVTYEHGNEESRKAVVQKVSEDEGIRFRTSGELDEEYPTWLSGQTTKTGQHTTQIARTVNTYKKIGEWLKANSNNDTRILDASSGLGMGTQALREMGFNVEDVEPYPSEDRERPTFLRYEDVDGKYDVVISNAVLNVIPDDWRQHVLHNMADKVADGGMIIINVRDAKEIEMQKQKIELDSPSEILVTDKKGNIRAYQKGFSQKELKDWVEKELGEGWTVENATEKNSGLKGARAIVVKKGKGALSRKEREREEKRSHAEELGKKFNTELTIVDDVNSITDDNPELERRMRNAKGWYDPKTGKVVVVMPNNVDVEDVASTVSHEVVAHKGLRELVGEDNYDDFLFEVYSHCKEDVRSKIDAKAAKHGWDFGKATDEYLGELGEKGFEDFTPGERSLWQELKDFVIRAIDKFLKTLHLPKIFKLGDNELRYMLWRSHENLRRGNQSPIETAMDVVKREELKVGTDFSIMKKQSPSKSESEQIVADAKANGTYLKAPNGKPTKLTERQWLQVRTKAFKEWFGDWEKAHLLKMVTDTWNGSKENWTYRFTPSDKLKKGISDLLGVEPVSVAITNSDVLHMKKHHSNVEYENKRGQKEVTPEDILSLEYIINNYDDIQTAESDISGNKRFKIRKITNGLVSVITVNKGKGKEFVITQWIEMSSAPMINSLEPNVRNALDIANVQKDLQRIKDLANNSSKIVDENGEPRVVYHQTNSTKYINRETGEDWDELGWREREEWNERSEEEWEDTWEEQDFYEFDNRNSRQSIEMPAFFFSPRYDEYHEYGDRTIAAFLNIRKPAKDPHIPNAGATDTAGKDAMDNLISEGYDGFIRTEDGELDEINAFYPNQIKSATENNGDFDPDKNDIRFRDGDGESEEEGIKTKKKDKKKPETEDIWLDQSLGMKERISAAAARLSQNHTEDKVLKQDAVNAIYANLSDLRKAMTAQKKFDQQTVKRVADLAKILMQYGYISNPSQGEIKNLIAAVKNSVGHDNVDASVDRIMEIMVDNQLKNGEECLNSLMKIKASNVEEKSLRDELKDLKAHTSAQDKRAENYKEAVRLLESAIRQNKIDRAQAYQDLVGRMAGTIRESVENAKEFKKTVIERVKEIHHNASRNMQGRPADIYRKDDWRTKMANSGIARIADRRAIGTR